MGVEVPSAGVLRSRALVSLVRRGHGVEWGSTVAPRTEAVVVVPVGGDGVADRVRALDGEPLSAEVADLISCDAHIQALLVGRSGQPLWLGRSSRLASSSQRRVLAIRDGGCVFPGCDMPSQWCDAHHQPGWEHGGTTDVDAMGAAVPAASRCGAFRAMATSPFSARCDRAGPVRWAVSVRRAVSVRGAASDDQRVPAWRLTSCGGSAAVRVGRSTHRPGRARRAARSAVREAVVRSWGSGGAANVPSAARGQESTCSRWRGKWGRFTLCLWDPCQQSGRRREATDGGDGGGGAAGRIRHRLWWRRRPSGGSRCPHRRVRPPPHPDPVAARERATPRPGMAPEPIRQPRRIP